jgi:hypothetical protein
VIRRIAALFVFGFALFAAPVLLRADSVNLSTSVGESITLLPLDRGWYGRSGFHNARDTAFVAGVGDAYRNFFVFDFSGVSGNVASARLELENAPFGATGSARVTLYDVQTAPDTLTRGQRNAKEIFNDLGSGTIYGSAAQSYAAVVSIELNADFLSAINSGKSGPFAIGGALGQSQGLAFAFAGPGQARLLLQFDLGQGAEPTSNPLPGVAAGGLILLGGLASNRRRH